MTTPQDPRDISAARVMRSRLSAERLLNTGNPYEEYPPDRPLPRAGEILYTYDDALANEDGDGSEENPNGSPAPLTINPTTTTNPDRPRTLAAGYDYPHRTMTVLFRDGVLYNYYGISLDTWNSFRRAFSKGVWLDDHFPRGGAWSGEKVSGGQSDLLADSIVSRAVALRQANIGRQIVGFTRDQEKVSGYRRAVLKYVNRGAGVTAREAQAKAKADLLFYRKKK